MRRRPFVVASLVVAALCVASRGPQPVVAGPGEDAAAKARIAALTARVRDWCEARKRLVRVDCPKCRGWGRVEDRSGRIATCPRCDGSKQVLAPDAFRKVHYDFFSPAFRGREGAMDAANTAYKAANSSGRPPLYFNAYRIDRVELVGVNGGSAWVFEGTDSVSRESRWLQLTDPTTKKPQWFVYDPTTDGEWPPPEPAPMLPEGPVPRREPLAPAELEALRKAVAAAGVGPGVEAARREHGEVAVGVFDGSATDEAALRASASAVVFRVAGAAFATQPDAVAVRVEFLARWRDRFGSVTKKPYRSATISRAHHGKIVPDRLSPDELLALFAWEDAAYEGEVLWWKD